MTRDDVQREAVHEEFGSAPGRPSTDRMADEIVRLRSALTHEAQWADAGIDSTAFWQHQRDDLVAQLAAVEAERDAMEGMYRHHVVVALDAIEKLNRAERTLAALREPSDMIVDALREHIYDLSCFDEAFKAIRIAVAAAEADASHGSRATQEAHDER